MNKILRIIETITNDTRTAKAVVDALNIHGFIILPTADEPEVDEPHTHWSPSSIERYTQCPSDEPVTEVVHSAVLTADKRESHELDAAVLMAGVRYEEAGGITEVDWDLTIPDEVDNLTIRECSQRILANNFSDNKARGIGNE